jgi:hypothetical protein
MVETGDAHGVGGGLSPERIRPSRGWYLAAVAALVVAVFWIGLGFWFLFRRIDGFERVPIPGELALMLAEAGDYIIYYEGPGAGSGVVLSAFEVTLKPTDEKELVPLSRYGGSLTYSAGGHTGFAVFRFEIHEPRSFLLTTTHGGGPLPSQVAVGTSFAPLLVGTIVGGLAWFFVSVVFALVVFLRRRRARRAIPPDG